MAHGHWVWVCTCGAHMRPGPGLPEDDPIYAHMDHHKEALALAAHEEGAVSALPRVMTTPPAALPPPGYEARWTNLDTGEVDAGRTYVIENPEYEAFQRHGGTPYQIEPQHNDGPISPGDRLDRAIQDVDRAMDLIEKADRVLVEPATADRCRDRLARAVNLLSSAARDVDILRTELPIIYADREAVALQQRTWVPFEPQPMFGWDPEEGRYVREAGNVHTGPLTIREQLDNYWATLRQAARDAAMALLLTAETERERPARAPRVSTPYAGRLIGATSPTWEEGHNTLRELRSMLAAQHDLPDE